MYRLLHALPAGIQAVSSTFQLLVANPSILAANRDEFLDRPATPAAWHNFDAPSNDNWVLCGRDLGSDDKGTWLGMTRDLRIGIL